MEKIRWISLISGSGTTMAAVVEACRDGKLKGLIEPVGVISSKTNSEGVIKAIRLDIPYIVLENKNKLLSAIRTFNPDVITQNGWLVKTPLEVLEMYEGRIFNQHPGPLDPEHLGRDGVPMDFGGKGMYGLHVHEAVLTFQKLSGRTFPTEATIHRVVTEYDRGAVVARKEVSVFPYDSPLELAWRVLPIEHELMINFLAQFAKGEVKDLKRENPLIKLEEETFLLSAKQSAITILDGILVIKN